MQTVVYKFIFGDKMKADYNSLFSLPRFIQKFDWSYHCYYSGRYIKPGFHHKESRNTKEYDT